MQFLCNLPVLLRSHNSPDFSGSFDTMGMQVPHSSRNRHNLLAERRACCSSAQLVRYSRALYGGHQWPEFAQV